MLTQTKRFPLVWDELVTPLPTWRALLAGDARLRDAPWLTSNDWVLKPALGRVGEGIGLQGVVDVEGDCGASAERRGGGRARGSHNADSTRFPSKSAARQCFRASVSTRSTGGSIGAYGRARLACR